MKGTGLVDKVSHKRACKLRGYAPHKMFKLEIRRKYLEKKKDVFDIDKHEWRELEK